MLFKKDREGHIGRQLYLTSTTTRTCESVHASYSAHFSDSETRHWKRAIVIDDRRLALRTTPDQKLDPARCGFFISGRTIKVYGAASPV
ncbi:hypothetical protein P3T22_003451 [Paraburkholderia sp. GAS348]